MESLTTPRCLATSSTETHGSVMWELTGAERKAPRSSSFEHTTLDLTGLNWLQVYFSRSRTRRHAQLDRRHNQNERRSHRESRHARLTQRWRAAADILVLPLLDHLIVPDAHRHYSFREVGRWKEFITAMKTSPRFDMRILWKRTFGLRLRSLR